MAKRFKRRQKVLDLRPTQFAVGMLEVDEKIKALRGYSKKQLRAYVGETPVPVVISHEKHLYIVDHHHFVCVCYQLNIKKVHIKIIKDFSRSKISYQKFWRWMFASRNAYPFCQFGEGPRKALYLPRDIRGLADDPYRSLAWFVRKAGAFEASEKNFAEFKWANFFRSKNLLDRHGYAGMPQAMVQAVKQAQSPSARTLPGFGKLNLTDTAKAARKAHARGEKIKAMDKRC